MEGKAGTRASLHVEHKPTHSGDSMKASDERRFDSDTFHQMRGELVFDIVDTGDITRINNKRCEGNPRDG